MNYLGIPYDLVWIIISRKKVLQEILEIISGPKKWLLWIIGIGLDCGRIITSPMKGLLAWTTIITSNVRRDC